MNNISRRRWLAATALTAAGVGALTIRGVRYPRFTLTPEIPSAEFQIEGAKYLLAGAIATPSTGVLRAIQPEPSLRITSNGRPIGFKLNNVMLNATLVAKSADGKKDAFVVSEQIQGITREVKLEAALGSSVELQWIIDHEQQYRFAIIGDSGGGDELTWCLQRAAQLDVQFVLHLGDFNYARHEYPLAIKAFAESRVPCYVAIGNHDFNDKGLVFEHFLDHIGRFNHAFTIAGTQFLNIDTAASFFPLRGGQRGQFLKSLEINSQPKVAFTHRPFKDIRPGEDHALSSEAETQYLWNRLFELGCREYLCGHVHKSGETDIDGIRQWTVGEGLGYEDWVARTQVSKMLIGSIAPQQKPSFTWVELNMPWAAHTSHEHLEKLINEQPQSAVDWYLEKQHSLAPGNT